MAAEGVVVAALGGGQAGVKAPCYLGLTVAAYIMGSWLPPAVKLCMPPVFFAGFSMISVTLAIGAWCLRPMLRLCGSAAAGYLRLVCTPPSLSSVARRVHSRSMNSMLGMLSLCCRYSRKTCWLTCPPARLLTRSICRGATRGTDISGWRWCLVACTCFTWNGKSRALRPHPSAAAGCECQTFSVALLLLCTGGAAAHGQLRRGRTVQPRAC